MAHRTDVVQTFTSANTDALSGQALDPMPSSGVAKIFAASTVNTATIEIDPALSPNPTGTGGQSITFRANGEIRAYDPHWETEVSAGEKLTIRLAGTTGTIYLWVSFYGMD